MGLGRSRVSLVGVVEVRNRRARPFSLKFRTMPLGEDQLMKPGRPIEASESPDRAKPGPLLLTAAVAAGAIFLALILRRLR